MLKKLQLKSWLLMLCMLVGVGNAWGDEETITFSDKGYSNGEAVASVSGTAFTIAFDKGTNSNAPKYYTTGSAIRAYGGNTFTVSSEYTITEIFLTFATGEGTNAITTDVGTFSTDKWTGSGNTVVFTIGGTSGHRRIASIKVTYTTGGTPTVNAPTFSPSDGTYAEAQAVTIASSTEGATILYSIDGGTTWNEYSSAITVSETTTIQAKATKDGYNESAVASATYTIEAPTTIAEARAQGTGSVFTKGVVTSGVGVTGYIQDATAAICVYGANLTVGDEITVSGTLSTYNGLLEITSPSVSVLSSGNTVTPTVKTIAEINADYTGDNALQGWLIKIEEATVTAIDGSNTTIAQGENTIVVRGISDVEYAVNDLLTLEGNIGCYNAAQIANPQNVEVQKSTTPAINAENVTLADNATSGEIAYTIDNPVEGTSLTATSEAEWISNITVGESAVTFTTTANTGDEREGTITLIYGSLTKDITVTQSAYVDPNAPGTENNPYTVAQAIAAIDANTGVTGVYATGVVSKIVTAYSSQYGNISYNISADGSEDGDQLQAYRGKSYNGENFTSEDDIQVGDEVVIYGNLKKHNSTYEFDAGNQLVSLNRPVNPIINASNVTLDYDATSGEIVYTIENTIAGTALEATTTADWISDIVVDAAAITFTTTANEGTEDRTATITLTYGEVTKEVTVTQGHYVVDYATLPFDFDGGKADIEGTNGLTQSGLGSDYSSAPKLKFDSTGDELVLKFNKRPGTLTFDIQGNGFSGGTFKVQTSEDGETYTDLKTYTELASSSSESFDDIDKNVRYIKWVYTEKVSGNVALGNIILDRKILKGDVNEDGEVTIADVTALVNIILGKE